MSSNKKFAGIGAIIFIALFLVSCQQNTSQNKLFQPTTEMPPTKIEACANQTITSSLQITDFQYGLINSQLPLNIKEQRSDEISHEIILEPVSGCIKGEWYAIVYLDNVPSGADFGYEYHFKWGGFVENVNHQFDKDGEISRLLISRFGGHYQGIEIYKISFKELNQDNSLRMVYTKRFNPTQRGNVYITLVDEITAQKVRDSSNVIGIHVGGE